MKKAKNFMDFYPQISIGDSDVASLVFRTMSPSGEQVAQLVHFDGDGSYKAWECFGDELDVSKLRNKVLSGRHWLMIYDDTGRTYKRHPVGEDNFTAVDVYRLASRECIIHWHTPEQEASNG